MDIIQLSGSFIAILLLTGLVAWLFPVRLTRVADDFKREFMRYAPDLEPHAILVTEDGKSALILPVQANTSWLATVTSLGDKLVCRVFSNTSGLSYQQNGATFLLQPHDITCPPITLTLSTADAKVAAASLAALAPQGNANAA